MWEIVSDLRGEIIIACVFFISQFFHHNYIKTTLTFWLNSQIDELGKRGINLQEIQNNITAQTRLATEHNDLTNDVIARMEKQHEDIRSSMNDRHISGAKEHQQLLGRLAVIEHSLGIKTQSPEM